MTDVIKDLLNETVKASTEFPLVSSQTACLVNIYPTGPSMGARYPLGDEPVVIGRGEDCQIRANDQSVSRRHVSIERGPDGYRAIDQGSTNGTSVNKVMALAHDLNDGDYLQVGQCIYRFLAGGNIEGEYHEEIYRLAIIDALTGIHNKRYLLEHLEGELSRSARHGRPLSLILFDIDHFKLINDDLGHLAGDHILRELAACVRTTFHREELFARYGGEEFAVVLPEYSLENTLQLGERIRAQVAKRSFTFDGQSCAVTISVGGAHTTGAPLLSPQEFLALADEKLYQAKREGRNRVQV